nr:S1 RNA-binding domain-containing protein [Ardenticatena sp.]
MSEFTDAQQNDKQMSPMWQYLEQEEYDYREPEPGDIVEGVVVRKSNSEILVDLGLKREAVVTSRDIDRMPREDLDAIHVGDTVNVFVTAKEDDEGRRIVSINLAMMQEDWQRAEDMAESGEIFEGEVISYNKGGVIVPFGRLRGFVPASQLVSGAGQSFQNRLQGLVGKTLKLKVVEVNARRRRLIFSERAAMREVEQEQKEKLLETLQPGDVRKGVVTNLQPFGAFVDLGGADGLIHVSELAWHRVKHPRDVLEVGQEVEVYILKVDRENDRIGLSLKRLQPDPWSQVTQKYAVGDVVEAEITNLTEFGAFARIEDGIEGLIHISELQSGNVKHPREVVHRGQRVQVRIISIDTERQRIGLSLKRAREEEESDQTAEDVATTGEAAEATETALAAEEPVAETADTSVEAEATIEEADSSAEEVAE